MRPFRQGSTFGLVTLRERRNADLFLAELLGQGSRPVSRQNAEQFFAELAGEDEPREWVSAEVDEAEDTGPVTAPTVTDGRNNEIIVTRADGTRFHVRRKVRTTLLTDPGRLRTGFCRDDKRVFFRFAWCEGTQGTIDIGANPQSAFSNLVNTLINQVNQGQGPDQLRQTIENASIETFIEFDITKVQDWKIKGDVRLEFNSNGVPSKAASVSVDRPWGKIGVEYKDDPSSGKQVMVKGDFPLGKRTVAGKVCPEREFLIWWDIECLREVPTKYPIDAPPGGIPHRECLYIYFEHAMTWLRRDPKPTKESTDEVNEILRSDPKSGTARLNRRTFERLDYLVGQGYWLAAVNGYASPEGRRAPPAPGARGRGAEWEGNKILSERRANKVLKLIHDRYDRFSRTRFGPSMPPWMRFPKGVKMPTGTGLSEHPKIKLVRELEGSELDRAIILGFVDKDAEGKDVRVEPFLDKHKAELTRMTDDDRKFVTDKTKSIRSRAERLFENLRRVEIRLNYLEPYRGGKVTLFDLVHEPTCAADLIAAAESKWGPRIPLLKPDPPLCN